MKNKNIIWLVVLLVLSGLFIISKKRVKTEKKIKFFAVDSTQITSITCSNLTDTLQLELNGDKWMISSPISSAVDTNKIDSFFEKVVNAKASSTVVSKQASAWKKYNVDDSTATQVILAKGDKVLAKAYIGKASDYAYSYGRRDGKDGVYRIDGGLSYHASPALNGWRKKEILALEKDSIKEITVAYSKQTYTLAPADTSWTFNNGTESFEVDINNKALDRIVTSLKNLRVYTFYDNEYEQYASSFEKPGITVDITAFSGKKYKLEMIMTHEKKYVLKLNDQEDTLYDIRASFMDNFSKGPGNFSDPENVKK